MALSFVNDGKHVALYDTVTDWAFGPVFGSEEAAKRFLDWAESQGVKDGDVRALNNVNLSKLWDLYTRMTEYPRD